MDPRGASYPILRRLPCRTVGRRPDCISQHRPVSGGSRTPGPGIAVGKARRDVPADVRLLAAVQLPFERPAFRVTCVWSRGTGYQLHGGGPKDHPKDRQYVAPVDLTVVLIIRHPCADQGLFSLLLIQSLVDLVRQQSLIPKEVSWVSNLFAKAARLVAVADRTVESRSRRRAVRGSEG